MASNEIILYDIQSNKDVTTSPNVWKTRASLNFKELRARTEWLKLEDVEAFMKAHNVPPNPPGSLIEYTCPTVRMPDGSFIMDSLQIAKALDQLQPQPSLRCEGPCEKTEQVVTKINLALNPLFADAALKNLPQTTKEYYERTRQAWYGMPTLEYFELRLKDPDALWAEADVPIKQLKLILAEDAGGPYVLGKDPSFSDLIIAGLWKSFEIVNLPLLEKLLSKDDRFPIHQKACSKWMTMEW